MYQKLHVFSTLRTFSICVLCTIVLVSCTFPGLLTSRSYDSEEVIAQKATIAMRMTFTKAAENAPTQTPAPPTSTPTREVQCAFAWTLRQDDELGTLFTGKLDETIRNSAGLGAVWYGENCIDMETNSLVRFYAANLDITIMLERNEEITEQWLGDQIGLVMQGIEEGLLERQDVAEYPINMHFVYELNGENTYLAFDLATYRRINPENTLHGTDLFNALFD
jgi:hypothetical protein